MFRILQQLSSLKFGLNAVSCISYRTVSNCDVFSALSVSKIEKISVFTEFPHSLEFNRFSLASYVAIIMPILELNNQLTQCEHACESSLIPNSCFSSLSSIECLYNGQHYATENFKRGTEASERGHHICIDISR